MDSTRAVAGGGRLTALDMERVIATSGPDGKSDIETQRREADAVVSAEKLSPQDVSWLYRAMIAGLIGTMAIALIGLTWAILDGNDKTSPDLLLTVFTGALGGLVGLFARAPSS